ncbi:MAG: hypothetical protein Q8L52_00410 [bacterium]|nr:hypothetical protein [bacterium]
MQFSWGTKHVKISLASDELDELPEHASRSKGSKTLGTTRMTFAYRFTELSFGYVLEPMMTRHYYRVNSPVISIHEGTREV